MNDILKEAKRLGIKFEEEIEEDLERLSELQELLRQAERQSVYLEEEGEVTTLHDEVIAKVCEEIRALSKKIKRRDIPRLRISRRSTATLKRWSPWPVLSGPATMPRSQPDGWRR